MNNQAYIDGFKRLYIAMSNHYGDKWSDGTNADFQTKARTWLPELKRNFDAGTLIEIVERIENNEHSLKNIGLEDFITYFNNSDANYLPDTKEEEYIYEIIRRASVDYATPILKTNHEQEDISEKIKSFKDTADFFDFKNWDYLLLGYKRSAIRKNSHGFPPKVIEILKTAELLAKRDQYSDDQNNILKVYELLASNYGNSRIDYDETKFIDETMLEIKEYKATSNGILLGFKTALAQSDHDYKIPSVKHAIFWMGVAQKLWPDTDEAYYKAVNSDYEHCEEILRTVNIIGHSELTKSINSSIRNKFDDIYKSNCIKSLQTEKTSRPIDSPNVLEESVSVGDKVKNLSRIEKLINKIKK